MHRFVPMSDEMLYRAGGPPGRLVPYRVDFDCWRALGEDGIYHFNDDAVLAGVSCRRGDAANDGSVISPPLAQPA